MERSWAQERGSEGDGLTLLASWDVCDFPRAFVPFSANMSVGKEEIQLSI